MEFWEYCFNKRLEHYYFFYIRVFLSLSLLDVIVGEDSFLWRVSSQPLITVTRALEDGLNYELETGKTYKQHCTYHINVLSKWQSRDEMAALVIEESPEFAITSRKQCSPLWSRENLGRCYDLG